MKKQNNSSLRLTLLFVLLILSALTVSLYPRLRKWAGGYDFAGSIPDGALAVQFLDVGQGDASLIRLPDGKTVLIDAGTAESESDLIAFLHAQSVKTIDCMILSHPHEDHVGGAAAVLRLFSVKNVVMPDVNPGTTTFSRILGALDDRNVSAVFLREDTVLSVGDAVFRIFCPDLTDDPALLNEASLLVRLEYGDTSFLFTGDCEADAEESFLNRLSADRLDCDVLKVAHHGSSSSSSERFLAAASPSVSVISCGRNNDYGHPHRETLARLDAFGTVLRTDTMGHICVASDGTSLVILTSRAALPADSIPSQIHTPVQAASEESA